jgi:membrane peptidoglycan carboxypeptidase
MSHEPADDGDPRRGPEEDTVQFARPERRRTGWRRAVPTWRIVLGTFLFVVLLISGGFVAGYLLVDIPAPNQAAAAQTNVYLYSDGSQIARKGDVNRQKVGLSEIPLSTQHAVLAAEDRNFYHEPAVNVTAMARAGWNMLTGGGKQSGSTITQQYVKNYYLTQQRTVTRKVKEFFIAVKLDREVSKDEILKGYLNTVYFGRGAYGVESAAHAYYGKSASDLTTGEGAYLAALVNSPGAYDTRMNPGNKDGAVARWNYVLDGMVKEGWLSEAKRRHMHFPEPDAYHPPGRLSGQRGYLVKAIDDYLAAQGILSPEQLRRGGYRITTTLDPDKQHALVDAVHRQLRAKLDDQRKVDSYVRAGGTSIDPDTGDVVAMYGGVDYVKQYVDNATRRDYQVGSTFKPFVFASAVQNHARTQDGRLITADTVYDGTSGRHVVSDGHTTDYAPANEDHKSYGQIPVSEAMNKSVNAVFAQMGVDVGPQKVKDTAIALGLPKDTPNMPADASVSLGVSTASTLDMAEAYATLAHHGVHTDHRLVQKVTHGTESVDVPAPHSERAVSRVAADSTTAILQDVVKSGTGAAAQAAGRPAAGKTGTAEEDRAAWFAGYTPDLATVVAVMGQNPQGGHEKLYGAGGLPRVNGADFPAHIWAAYTADALSGQPVHDFHLQTNKGQGGNPSPSPSGSASGGSATASPPQTGAPTASPTGGPTSPTGEPTAPPTWPTAPPTSPTIPPPQDGGPLGGQTGGGTGGPRGGTGGPGGGTGGPGGGTGGGGASDGSPSGGGVSGG